MEHVFWIYFAAEFVEDVLIIDRPPYLVSRNLIDLESGETSFHVSLIEWQPLGS